MNHRELDMTPEEIPKIEYAKGLPPGFVQNPTKRLVSLHLMNGSNREGNRYF